MSTTVAVRSFHGYFGRDKLGSFVIVLLEQMFVLLFKSTDNYLYLKSSSLFSIVGFYSHANEVGFLALDLKIEVKSITN